MPPREIALAAVAEVVRLRREGRPEVVAAGPPAGYVNPVCGAAITAGMVIHTLEHDGMLQYFCCDHCKIEFEREPDKYTVVARQRATAPT